MNGRIAATAAAVLLTSSAATAADAGPYAGLFVGKARHDVARADFREDELRAGTTTFDSGLAKTDWLFGVLGVTLGWQFTPWLAIEGSYSYPGESEYSASWIERGPQNTEWHSHLRVTYRPSAYAASAIVRAPLGAHFSAGARAGVAYSRLKESVFGHTFVNATEIQRLDEERTFSNVAPLYGLNVELTPKPYLSFRLDWQRFSDVGDSGESKGFDVDAYSFSALYRVAL